MNLIQCAQPCRHQKDGYCTLEAPAAAHSSDDGACIHFQRANAAMASPKVRTPTISMGGFSP